MFWPIMFLVSALHAFVAGLMVGYGKAMRDFERRLSVMEGDITDFIDSHQRERRVTHACWKTDCPSLPEWTFVSERYGRYYLLTRTCIAHKSDVVSLLEAHEFRPYTILSIVDAF